MPPAGLSDHRDELTGHLAAAFRATAGERIGPDLATAAARAVVVGEPLPGAFTQALGDAPACAFVSFDADQIQRWVFASERVQVTKGASQTLEFLQVRENVDRMVREIDGLQGVIYAAGAAACSSPPWTPRPLRLPCAAGWSA